MQTVYWVILVCAALFLLLIFSPVRAAFSWQIESGTSRFALYAGVGFIQINITKLLQKKKPEKQDKKAKKTEEKEEESGQKEKKQDKPTLENVENTLQKGINAVKYLRKKFTVKLFSLQMRMGLPDAAQTGIATGAAYAALYRILGAIDHYFILKKQDVSITPVYQGTGIELMCRGEVQLRILYCIGLINKLRKDDVK